MSPKDRENVLCKSVNGSFELSFDAEYQQGNVDFGWRDESTARQWHRHFRMEGRRDQGSLTSRLGLCVLHPIHELAERVVPFDIRMARLASMNFPYTSPPINRLPTLRRYGIKWILKYGPAWILWEKYVEMEDQRNWTDGSYKTYCPPLSVPYPREITPDVQIDQSYGSALTDTWDLTWFKGTESVGVSLTLSHGIHGAFPSYRTRLCRGIRLPERTRQWENLKRLNLSHLRLDLKLSQPDYRRFI